MYNLQCNMYGEHNIHKLIDVPAASADLWQGEPFRGKFMPSVDVIHVEVKAESPF